MQTVQKHSKYQMRKQVNSLILLIFILVSFSSCDKNRIFEQNKPIEDGQWFYNQPLSFEINVDDSTSTYNLFINVRHTHDYGFKNLWLKIGTKFPDEVVQEDRIELSLSEADGTWYGNCSGNFCYQQSMIQRNLKFNQLGLYTFILSQDMRSDPVEEIVDIGIKVEKLTH